MHRGGGCKFISKIMLVLNNPLLIFGQQLESENVRDAGDLGDVLVLSLFDVEWNWVRPQEAESLAQDTWLINGRIWTRIPISLIRVQNSLSSMPSDVNISVDTPPQMCSPDRILVNVRGAGSGPSPRLCVGCWQLMPAQMRAGTSQRLWTLLHSIWGVYILLNLWFFSPLNPCFLGCLEKVKGKGLGNKSSSLTTAPIGEDQLSESSISIRWLRRTVVGILRPATQQIWSFLQLQNFSAQSSHWVCRIAMCSAGLGVHRFKAQCHGLSSSGLGKLPPGLAGSPDSSLLQWTSTR